MTTQTYNSKIHSFYDIHYKKGFWTLLFLVFYPRNITNFYLNKLHAYNNHYEAQLEITMKNSSSSRVVLTTTVYWLDDLALISEESMTAITEAGKSYPCAHIIHTAGNAKLACDQIITFLCKANTWLKYCAINFLPLVHVCMDLETDLAQHTETYMLNYICWEWDTLGYLVVQARYKIPF